MRILYEIGFVLLVLAPIGIAALLAISCRRRGEKARIVAGLLAAVAVFGIQQILLHPLAILETYDRFGYSTAIAVGLYVTFWLAHRDWRRVLNLIGIIFCGLFAMFVLYIISIGYSDNTRNRYPVFRNTIARTLESEVYTVAADRVFPAGDILPGSPILAVLSKEKQETFAFKIHTCGFERKIFPRWHTPITGLYRVEMTPMRLWYPGGKVKDQIGKMKWRRSSDPTGPAGVPPASREKA